jgi:hypothetical protein
MSFELKSVRFILKNMFKSRFSGKSVSFYFDKSFGGFFILFVSFFVILAKGSL